MALSTKMWVHKQEEQLKRYWNMGKPPVSWWMSTVAAMGGLLRGVHFQLVGEGRGGCIAY